MMMDNNYCVYTHTSPSGKLYIGQTNNYKRRWGYNGEHYKNKKKDGSYVQPSFARAIDKYGWNNFTHSILLDGISKKEADYAEKYLIKWYKLQGMSYNITDGGEGTCGLGKPLSEERKNAIRAYMIANPPMKGKHHTVETRRKIAEANKRRKYTEEQKAQMRESGKRLSQIPISEERREKYRAYRKAHPETWIGGWNKKEVHQYDLEGNYIASFPSATEAAISLGKNLCASICACINGVCLSAGGYIWRANKVDCIDMSDYKILKTPKGARIYDTSDVASQKRRAAHGKAVNQYSIDGKYIASYISASEAARILGYSRSGIARCCKQLPKYKTAHGFIWRYDSVTNRENIEVNHDNAEANDLEREKMAEEARQFDEKLSLERQKQQDDVRLKEKQINISKTSKK